jgi:rRNA processing protein Krr1/Pno1
MTLEEKTIAIEEVKTPSKTERFAQWLMTREERRAEKESNLESLIRLNVLVSFLTLGLVGGFETVQLAITMIPYLG